MLLDHEAMLKPLVALASRFEDERIAIVRASLPLINASGVELDETCIFVFETWSFIAIH